MQRSLLLAAVLAAGPLVADEAPRARSFTLVGELVQVDASGSSITLRVSGKPPKDHALAVEPETRLVSEGRALRLAELRPGGRALAVVSEDASGRRRLTLLKLTAPSKPPRP
jgi:hypothetical protein